MKESAIQKKIIDWIKSTFEDVIVWKMSDMFNRGRPDLLVLFKARNGYVETDDGLEMTYRLVPVFIECKRPGERPTALQQKALDELTRLGGVVLVATSVREVEIVLDAIGIGTRKAAS